ncbi:mucin-binding protein [Streptococcus mitis]|uniref:mucin-binding protein n=1 Tax=Streptococcus mitis TaxID=28037 RepID=UPI0021B51BCE|nr:MucBP domain-containing protein [Streptococcus mitis]
MYSRMEKYHGRRAQRFSIRKYSFGAASVLLGTALLLGTNAVKADETNTGSAKATEITNPDKQKPDSAITTPVVEELPELKLDAVKADEKSEVKEEAKPVAEKEVTDKAATEKSDKEQADKKEVAKEKTDKETSEKAETVKPKDEVKTVLTQLTSEAEVMATVASNFSDKEAKDVEAKQKLSAAIAAVKLEAVASKGLLSSDASKDQMVAQVNRLSAAIEAVYAEMKRAGHAGKVEAVLAETHTGKALIKEGKAVVNVQNAYITMNADNSAPTAWGIEISFDTSRTQKGDTTKIELKNLAGFGDAFKVGTPIKAADGTTIGVVKSAAQSNSTGNKGTTSPYWAQRMKDGMTYEERLAEQPAIPNEVGTITYTIEWNEKASNYPVTTYSVENLTGSGYYAPQISKDTEYTAEIKVDGQKVLEHTYIHKATKPSVQKQSTSVSLLTDNGVNYNGSSLVKKNDSVVINTDTDVRYSKGSKFTIDLPNDEFTYFRELGNGKNSIKSSEVTYRPSNRWSNVQANQNNVWILQDGRDTSFTLKATLKSPTRLELEVIDGVIQEGSTVSMALDKLGIEKVLTPRTFSDDFSKIKYDELGRVAKGSTVGNDKTSATLSVTGGTPLNGQTEEIATKVNNGWEVSVIPNGSTTVETGAVTLTLKDLETGKIIGYIPTEYNGYAPLKEDGTYETKNILGKKYDVTNQIPDLVKPIAGVDYILAEIPPKGPAGTINVSDKRIRDIYTADEITAAGLNPNAYVNNVIYSYVKKTKVEEVNRTIKYVYADDVKNLAGQQVFEPTKQTVSYTGTVKLNSDGKAAVDSNDKPIYVNWVGNGDTNLPEVTVPQKEGYIASVEKVPVQPTTATDEDYEYVVTYSPIQKAKTTFVYQDKDGNVKQVEGNTPISETGKGGDKLTKADEIAARIKEAQNKGYEVVSNTYPTDGVFDKDVDTDQEFTVTLKERVVPVTPDQPKTPGTPVDPNNPDGPKYPAGLEEKDLNKTVTRTITYVYEDGTPVLNEDGTPKTVTQEAKFTREAKVNLVTGEVTYGDWTPAQDLAEVKSPVVKGFLADKASVPVVNVTGDSEDIKEVVTYKPLGSWVPNIPGQPTNPIKYPNDPTDPTKPGQPTEVVPYVPGYTPKDGNGQPLKPVDPNNPTKGYEVPSVPTNPGEDTPINYVKDTQKAKTTFVDEKGNPIPGVDAITEEGDSDTPLTKEAEVKAKIKELENKGYELVSNTYPEGGKFDKDKDTDQEFKVTLKERVVPVTPDQPKTPGTPVDPNNPDGPKYPAGLEEKDLNKTVTRTITYVYEDGTPVLNEDGTPKTVTQEAKFTREAKVNLVTGEVTYGDWTPAQDLAEVKSPVVKGYLADKATVPTTKVTADSENTTEVVTYKPLGSWIPNIPGQPTNPIKYPNDPTDPTKPGQPTEVVPYVPGYTPKDGNGQPLKPVDPNDPTKGYEVPNVPTDPGKDTVINYEANDTNLVVKYVDENGKELKPTETTKGKVGDEYTTEGKVIDGYVLVRVEGEAKGKIGKDGSTVTYVYKPLGSWVPNIPGQPTDPIKYPNDPTDPTKPGKDKPVLPYVPGYTPKDKDGNPLKPVDPNDPTKGYEVPSIPTDPSQDTPINYVANKANLVVKYVDEKGKDLLPAETTEGKVGDEYATSGKVIKGYVLVRVDGEAKGKIGKDGSTVTYVYKPLGSWVPNIPGQPTDPIKYPNDPTDPTKPGQPTEVLPYVPGFTPEDKDGNPLKPVDPKDPSKGYVVPNIPTDPSQDTVINYVANKAKLVVKYVDEKGKDLIPSETTEGKVGDEYTTTGKVIPGHLLVRVDGDAKGKIGTDGSTVTYVYKPIGSWIPNIPGQPTDPIKYPNDPTDPTKPGQPTEVLPYVPGFTPEDKDGNPLKPVDPKDPSKGYVVPNIPTDPSQDTVINYVANKAKLVVKYVDEKGKDLLPAETTEGKVGDEYATSGKVIKGYVLVRVDGEAKGKIGKDGSTVTYVYKPLGSWVPNIPGQPTDPIKYPNDPTDPTKPGQPTEVLPYVPGFTPEDKDGNPLKPVDPKDPTKGYVVPNIPTDPSQDTVINYVPNPREVEKPAKPAQPSKSSKQETPKYVEGQKELPNTGTEASASLASLGLLGALGGIGLLTRKKKED